MKGLLFFLSIISLSAFAQNATVHYEPAIIELIGQLDLQTFPGAPNYESIKNGDEVEKYFYLKLKNPIDVIAFSKDAESSFKSESFFNVQILQLVVHDDKHMSILRKTGEGGHVKIRGTLFHRFTGHHHSRVLLEVENIKKFDEIR